MPDHEILEEIAIELGVDASFIEKDWYAVQLLKIIAGIKDEKFTPIFSGGTSLSKGYGLIERFSEDLDFKINSEEGHIRGERRSYREKIIQAIEENDLELKITDSTSRDSSKFTRIEVSYPKTFQTPGPIRPHLQLEFTFGSSETTPEEKEISSFETEYKNDQADCTILCISPVETAGDKLSALIWRTKNRDRGHENDDPSIIRHLHDLAKLQNLVNANPAQFNEFAWNAYENDQDRGKAELPKSLVNATSELIATLEQDDLYRSEYQNFVTGLSYANEDALIDFDGAIIALRQISAILERPC